MLASDTAIAKTLKALDEWDGPDRGDTDSRPR